jgi:hypothetical protein
LESPRLPLFLPLATARLGQFWKVRVGKFWRAPKNNLVAGTGVPKVDVHGSPLTMTSYQTGQIIGDFSTVWRGREEHNACR